MGKKLLLFTENTSKSCSKVFHRIFTIKYFFILQKYFCLEMKQYWLEEVSSRRKNHSIKDLEWRNLYKCHLCNTFPFSLRNGFSFPLPFFFTVEEALELSDTVLDSESVTMFLLKRISRMSAPLECYTIRSIYENGKGQHQ